MMSSQVRSNRGSLEYKKTKEYSFGDDLFFDYCKTWKTALDDDAVLKNLTNSYVPKTRK